MVSGMGWLTAAGLLGRQTRHVRASPESFAPGRCAARYVKHPRPCRRGPRRRPTALIEPMAATAPARRADTPFPRTRHRAQQAPHMSRVRHAAVAPAARPPGLGTVLPASCALLTACGLRGGAAILPEGSGGQHFPGLRFAAAKRTEPFLRAGVDEPLRRALRIPEPVGRGRLASEHARWRARHPGNAPCQQHVRRHAWQRRRRQRITMFHPPPPAAAFRRDLKQTRKLVRPKGGVVLPDSSSALARGPMQSPTTKDLQPIGSLVVYWWKLASPPPGDCGGPGAAMRVHAYWRVIRGLARVGLAGL